MLTQFVAAFDDIVIGRFNKNRNEQDRINVRYLYAPKQRVLQDIINENKTLTLPVVSVNVNSISRDESRVFNKLDGFYYQGNIGEDKVSRHIKAPIPVNIELSVSILTRYQTDMDQILSNFVPFCNPYVVVSWKIPEDFGLSVDQEIRSEVMWNGDVSLNYPTELAGNQKARVTGDTSFTIKGWLFKDTDDPQGNIFYIDNNFRLETELENYDNFESLSANDYDQRIETISISGNPQITGIFYNNVNMIEDLTLSPFASGNVLLQGYSFNHTTNVLVSSNNPTAFNALTTIDVFDRQDPITGQPIPFTVLNENVILLNSPSISAGKMRFIPYNVAGYDFSDTAFRSDSVNNAIATVTLSNSSINTVTLVNGGSGYKTVPDISLLLPSSQAKNISAEAILDSGTIGDILVRDPGLYYRYTPEFNIDSPPTFHGNLGKFGTGTNALNLSSTTQGLTGEYLSAGVFNLSSILDLDNFTGIASGADGRYTSNHLGNIWSKDNNFLIERKTRILSTNEERSFFTLSIPDSATSEIKLLSSSRLDYNLNITFNNAITAANFFDGQNSMSIIFNNIGKRSGIFEAFVNFQEYPLSGVHGKIYQTGGGTDSSERYYRRTYGIDYLGNLIYSNGSFPVTEPIKMVLSAFQLNRWHHLLIGAENDNEYVYIDGVNKLENKNPFASKMITVSGFKLGSSIESELSGVNYVNAKGLMSDFRVQFGTRNDLLSSNDRYRFSNLRLQDGPGVPLSAAALSGSGNVLFEDPNPLEDTGTLTLQIPITGMIKVPTIPFSRDLNRDVAFNNFETYQASVKAIMFPDINSMRLSTFVFNELSGSDRTGITKPLGFGNKGFGYFGNVPTIHIPGPNATPEDGRAQITATINSDGVVSSLTITNSGFGYNSDQIITIGAPLGGSTFLIVGSGFN
jgi:hypothetical protein